MFCLIAVGFGLLFVVVGWIVWVFRDLVIVTSLMLGVCCFESWFCLFSFDWMVIWLSSSCYSLAWGGCCCLCLFGACVWLLVVIVLLVVVGCLYCFRVVIVFVFGRGGIVLCVLLLLVVLFGAGCICFMGCAIWLFDLIWVLLDVLVIYLLCGLITYVWDLVWFVMVLLFDDCLCWFVFLDVCRVVAYTRVLFAYWFSVAFDFVVLMFVVWCV